MLPRPIWAAGLTALAAIRGVAGQASLANSTIPTNSTSSSDSTNSTNAASAILAALPSCALPCLETGIQQAGCSLNTLVEFEDCLCTNVTMQLNLAKCVVANCPNLTQQALATSVEQSTCKSYPQESRQMQAVGTSVVTIVISLPVLIARLAARYKLTSRLWMDDYMAIAATVILLGLSGMFIDGVHEGFGLHYWNVPFSNHVMIGMLLWVAQVLYNVVQCVAKIGILLLYRRIFDAGGATTKWFRTSVNVLLVLTFINGVTSTFIMIFQCLPVGSVWDKSIPTTKCINPYAFFGSSAAIGIITDFILIALPIPMLRGLQISTRKKIGIGFMFAVASLGTVASIVRLKFLIGLGATYDNTYEHVEVIVWSLIELLCTVVCGSIPALRPYLKYMIPKFGTVSTGKDSTSNKASRPSTYFTKGSRGTSTIYSKSTFSDMKRASGAYPMSPITNPPKYPWQEEIPEEEIAVPQSAVVRSTPLHVPININAHMEARPEHLTRTSSSASSGSESDLIFQGVAV